MTKTAGLQRALTSLTADRNGWRWTVEVDSNGWWLTHDGRRMQRQRWRPRDEADVLVVVALLFQLNDGGPVPIKGDYLDAAKEAGMTEAQIRTRLNLQAYQLLIRLRTGRPRRT
ncbi:MAG TPA: hypothetical protein VFV66_24415 [Nonomuraea sp.]|nr:hypothetical protein [Nonomuraea sp.]